MYSNKPYTFDRVVRLVIAVVLIGGAVYLIDVLKDVLLPFLVACLIAYILEPFVQFNRRLLHLRGRITAVFVTLFETLFFLSVFCYFIIPSVMDEAHKMAIIFDHYASGKASLPFLPASVDYFLRHNIDFRHLSHMLTRQEWKTIIEKTLTTGWDLLTGSIAVVAGIVSWCIVILYVIFIMIDYDRLARSFRRMVPPKYRHTTFRIASDIKRSMNHYFRGQALVSLCVGVLFAIGFYIIGLPMAVVMGIIIFILTMVPYLQLLSIPLVAILCLISAAGGTASFWALFGESIAVYCIVQVINDLFLTPKIMGKAMGLNPAIILLSLSVWGTLLGLIGLIIALPMTTLLIAYYDEYIISREDVDKNIKHNEEEALRDIVDQ